MLWPPTATLLQGAVVDLRVTDPAADAVELFAALDSPRVWEHVGGRPRHPGEMQDALTLRQERGWCLWTVRLRDARHGLDAGAAVGLTAYMDISQPDAYLEIGWTAYRPAVWGGTVNPDTKFLLLRHAFEVLGAGRVQLKTDARNRRSQQAIARLGATHEGTLRRHRRRDDGTVRDTVVFSIIHEEWPAVRHALEARRRPS